MIFEQAQESATYLANRFSGKIDLAIMTGTGSGNVITLLEVESIISYDDIPNFPSCSVQSHGNQVVIGTYEGKRILVFNGRFHYYEGYSLREVSYPVRVLQAMGIGVLIISNASGALNPDFSSGDIVIIKDHINLFPENPLRGVNDERLGDRFPDMSNAYDENLRLKCQKLASNMGIELHEGVYCGLQGPSLETPAEYNYLYRIGADLVGMSTVPEVIVANQAGIKVLGLSVVSNTAHPGQKLMPTLLQDVINVCEEATPRLNQLIKSVLKEI